MYHFYRISLIIFLFFFLFKCLHKRNDKFVLAIYVRGYPKTLRVRILPCALGTCVLYPTRRDPYRSSIGLPLSDHPLGTLLMNPVSKVNACPRYPENIYKSNPWKYIHMRQMANFLFNVSFLWAEEVIFNLQFTISAIAYYQNSDWDDNLKNIDE